MNTETKVTFALLHHETGKILLDFGTSEQMMRDYLNEQFKIHGSYPRGIPSKVTTVTTTETVTL